MIMLPALYWKTFTMDMHLSANIKALASQMNDEALENQRIMSPDEAREQCDVPPGGYRGWIQGVVTVVTPEVHVNCSRVISGDKEEEERIESLTARWKNDVSDRDVLLRVQNCSWLREYFTNNLYISKIEREFPIAFSFVVHDSPQQVLRLLRLLYRPHNSYCIHTDIKSPRIYKTFFRSIAKCFDNVITPSVEVSVIWGYYTIIEAQMNCMKDLLTLRRKQKHKWMYVINLCGKELPLVTLKEVVTRLIRLNGSSSILVYRTRSSGFIKRIKHPVTLNSEGTRIIVHKRSSLRPPPFPLSLFGKSSSYNAISVSFARFLKFSPKAQETYNFFKKCKIPDEHFYAVLYKTPGAPGGYDSTIPGIYYFEVAASLWSKPYPCHGKVVHRVCVVSAGDLVSVVKKTSVAVFFNKYFMEYDHTVMTCMEERIVARNKKEYLEDCG